jgi:hypothetical protein
MGDEVISASSSFTDCSLDCLCKKGVNIFGYAPFGTLLQATVCKAAETCTAEDIAIAGFDTAENGAFLLNSIIKKVSASKEATTRFITNELENES